MLLCGEVMAITIRTNTNVIPYHIAETSQKLSQYADDTQTMTSESLSSVNAICTIFESMEDNIGLKVNYEKSVIHMIGGSKPVDVNKPFKWTTDPPELLGVKAFDYENQ